MNQELADLIAEIDAAVEAWPEPPDITLAIVVIWPEGTMPEEFAQNTHGAATRVQAVE